MNTIEKAKHISTLDSKFQQEGGELLDRWEQLVSEPYTNAKGKGYGWTGIAEKDPEVIESLYPQVEKFR